MADRKKKDRWDEFAEEAVFEDYGVRRALEEQDDARLAEALAAFLRREVGGDDG